MSAVADSKRSRAGAKHADLIAIWTVRIILCISVLAAWEIASAAGYLNPIFFGRPSGILQFLWEGIFVNGVIVRDFLWTLGGTLGAFILGSAAGILLGLFFVMYPFWERVLDPFIAALNALPRIALAPLFLLWFGLGLWSKIALGASLTVFIVLSSTVAGIRSVEQDFLTLTRTLGARPSQIFIHITLPSAIPTIFSGLRLGLIYAMLGVVAGEIIGAEVGLGQRLSYLAGSFETNGVFAVLALLSLLGTSITWIMSLIEARLLEWQ